MVEAMSDGTPRPKFPDEIWDGTTPKIPDVHIRKTPDVLLGERYRAEIRSLEEVLTPYIRLLETIKNYGVGNSLLGVKSDGTELEYKVLVEGSGVTIVHGPGSITISSTGDGFLPLTAEADATIKIGNPIRLKANGHVEPAQANTLSTSHVVGIAITDTEPTYTCKYLSEGQVNRTDWTDIAGSANLTPGATYFLSTSQAGKITTIAPSTQSQYVVRVGRAIDVLTLDVEIEWPILL